MAAITSKLVSGLRKRINRLGPDVQVAERHGARFVLAQRNWIDDRLLAGRPFEDAQIARLRRRLAETRYDLALDIGANFGLYAVLCGVHGTVSQIHAFEPARRNYNQLCANVFANRLDDRVQAHRLALGATAGEAILRIDPTSTGVSRLADASDRVSDAQLVLEERVEVRRLDDVISARGVRAFVKIDVEGRELDVLEGGQAFLTSNAVELQIEAFEPEPVRARLAAWGYAQVDAIEHDLFFERAP